MDKRFDPNNICNSDLSLQMYISEFYYKGS